MDCAARDSHRFVDPGSRQKGAASNHEAYDDEEIAKAASDFFSTGAKGLSDVLAKVLKDKGPTDRLHPWRGVRRAVRTLSPLSRTPVGALLPAR
jgi:hypothetical protein